MSRNMKTSALLVLGALLVVASSTQFIKPPANEAVVLEPPYLLDGAPTYKATTTAIKSEVTDMIEVMLETNMSEDEKEEEIDAPKQTATAINQSNNSIKTTEDQPVVSTPKNTPTKPTPKPTPSPIKTEPEPTKPVIPEPVKPFEPLPWGVYTGASAWAVEDFEKRISSNPDYLAYFVHWGNDNGRIPPWLTDYAYNKGRTLVIFWEASDHLVGGTDQPEYAYRTILNGDWDEYIEDFAKQTKDYKGDIILIPFSELNGNWTPWSGTKNGNTPEQAVAAYRYVDSFFDGISNVKMGWAVNSHSVPNTPENSIESYYPGDAYVDIVGVDGFNMNWPWMSFSELFDHPLRTVSQYGKPVFVFSFGSAEGPKKAEWLRDALYTQLPRYPLVEGWIYFNQNKERNWLLWSDEDTFEVFSDYVEEK